MTHNKSVSFMWVGKELNRIACLSLNSALFHGYSPVLYAYDEISNVPDGITVVNGSQIIHSSKVFKTFGSYARFSDLFRFTLLSTTDTTWCDLDVIFLSNRLDMKAEYLFGYQHDDKESYFALNCAVLRYPKNCKLSSFLNSKFIDLGDPSDESIPFETTGPAFITDAVRSLDLLHFAKPRHYLYPIGFNESWMFFRPDDSTNAFRACAESPVVHVWNHYIHHKSEEFSIKPNEFPEGSFLSILESRFV